MCNYFDDDFFYSWSPVGNPIVITILHASSKYN